MVAAVAAARRITLKKPLLRQYEWSGRDQTLVLARPLTFMNRSGTVLPALLRRTGASVAELVVVCDNLDLPAGTVRLKRRGSSRSHNGLASIMDELGTGEFMRLYIGIGRPPSGISVVDHVLTPPSSEEAPVYAEAVARAARAVDALSNSSPEAVMNELNARA